ncbi:carboxypeptidase-like regulatory domain-containing protein [Flavobacterium sp.]|uniref:carboxypeptidase-like regulatory domain-containing protein n=1 Tax=Flavobacterium sp. TaxID=239 RepID=UPI00375342CE
MKLTITLLFLITCSLTAQVKGIVVDQNDTPIPYVNIWVEGENIGTTSEVDGSFNLDSKNKEKNLIFSAIGYKKEITPFKEKIVLEKEIYKLDEVLISSLKQTKEIEIGDSKKRFYLPEPQTTPWIFARNFQVDKNNKEVKYAKEIVFFTNSEVKNGVFRVRIFKIGPDGIPNEDILNEELLVEVKKGKQKTVVDILKYKIEIPPEGIIIGFESLIIDQNKYMQKATIYKTNKKTECLNYSPHIMYFNDDTVDNYSFSSGRWLVINALHKEKYKGKYNFPNPAINLILTN